MCTLLTLRRPGHAWPVIIAANRDEMADRPWRPPARHWPDRPEVIGGLDVLAGGSWLALNDHGLVAAILNRINSLGPQDGRRSRGELVLEALDHADAAEAAAALGALEPRSYRPFNLVIADNTAAYWLRHADPTGVLPIDVIRLPDGLSMIAAGDLDDPHSPRIARYRPRFLAAAPPDPDREDWADWQALLDDPGEDGVEPAAAMNFATGRGFATLASSLLALPAVGRAGVRPAFRFAARRPAATPWRPVDA